MKKTIISFFLLFCCITIAGQSSAEILVQQFGNNLRDWCSTKDFDYKLRAQKQCNDACRVKDKIMEDFAVNYGLNLKDFVVSNYLIGFQKALIKGPISISMRNIRTIPKEEQTEYSKEYTAISCDIVVNGTLNYNIRDLYYIHISTRKIVKITPYEEFEDPITGKRKVKVDFSDLEDFQTFGVSYNYGKNWPIGLSFNYSYSMFMISADIGVNLDKDKLYKQNLEMTDVMNYRKEDIEYDPLFYFTVTPSLYLKYISIGCGAGILYMKGTKYIANSSSESYDNKGEDVSFSYTTSSSYTTEESCEKVKFMLRPSIKGFIPITDEIFLSLSVGYDYVFGYKEKNGINFGLGLQFEL